MKCDRYFESRACSRLLELARQTKRYSICVLEPDQFEVFDDRYLLDQLLRFSELRPTTNDWLQIEFDEAVDELSSGPMLSEADEGMLAWLLTTVEVLDPKCENTAFKAAYQRAVIFRGTLGQVEYFLHAALDHRLESRVADDRRI